MPLSNHLFSVLRDPLRDYWPDDQDYDGAFDLFEYLLCLTYADLNITRAQLAELKSRDSSFTLWAPVGRFAFKSARGGVSEQMNKQTGGGWPQRVAALLQAGFFDSGGQMLTDKYENVKAGLDRHVARVCGEWGIYF